MRTLFNLVYSLGIYVFSFICAFLISKLIPDDFFINTIGCAEVLFGCLFQRGMLIVILCIFFIAVYYLIVKKVLKYKH